MTDRHYVRRRTGPRLPGSANCKAAVIIHDPLPVGALPVGLRLSKDEFFWMLHYGAFTPGTLLRRGRQLFRVTRWHTLEKVSDRRMAQVSHSPRDENAEGEGVR